MSSRAFRKLHGTDDLFPDLPPEESSDDETENAVSLPPPVGSAKTDAGNLFDLVRTMKYYSNILTLRSLGQKDI